ncbi:MAG: hypothetical protein CMP59_03900 [Flavobacteriales bacterium]|nr:hypothetical protein [Flavobacteriales bacterium]
MSKGEEQHLLNRKVDEILLMEDGFMPHKEALKAKSKLLKQSDSDLSERHIQRIIEFGHKPLIKGKSIAERLRNSEGSDWYYLRFSLFHRSRNQLISADEINEVLDTLDSDAKITLYHTNGIDSRLLKREVNQQTNPPQSKKSLPLDFIFNYLLLFFYRSIFGKRARSKSVRTAKKLIIANPYLEQEIIELGSGKLKMGDPHLQNVIDMSIANEDIIFLTQLRPPSLEANHQLKLRSYFRSRAYDRRSIYLEPYLLESFFSNDFKKVKREIRSLFSDLEDNIKDEKLSSEDAFLLESFCRLRKTLWLAKWREVAASRMFSKLNLESLLAIDEHSLQNRSILIPARKKQIKTYALQHGAISRANVAYRFTAADKEYKPWPDLSFIRGNHTKIQLEANCYPSSAVEVVGHLRTDVIPELKATAKGKSKIVYATQPMPPADRELKRRQLVDFLSLVKAFPDEEFVIKPHPNESEIADYYDLTTDPDYQNLSIYEGNLYHLLASCSFLITYYSTVGLEAIYFDKEVICLDYEKRDYQGYHAAEVAHRALNGGELIQLSRDILQGNLKSDQLKKNSFIEARAFRIDGKATERVMQFLSR